MTYSQHSKESSGSQHRQQPIKATAQTFSDNRESAAVSSPLQAMMANSPQQQKLKSAAQLMAKSPAQQNLNSAAQSFANKSEPMQRMDDEEPLQGKFETESEPAQLEAAPEAPRPNNTGLPDNLKSGIENLSGMSMDHVRVHYNSDKPAQLQAHAYAQGSEIHVAPGQEQHLPHEAWHVVQQAQGRVKPTIQMKGGVQINDDVGLEAEADLMGERAGTAAQQFGLPNMTGVVRFTTAMPVQREVFVTYNPSLSVTPRKRIASVQYDRDGGPVSAAKTWLRNNAALTSNHGECNHSRPHVDIKNSINGVLSAETTINQVSRTVRAWYGNLFAHCQAPDPLWEDTLENMSDTTTNPEEEQRDVNHALNWYLTRIADYPGNLFHWPNKVTNGGNDEPGAPNITVPGNHGGLTYRDTRANEITRLDNGRDDLTNEGI